MNYKQKVGNFGEKLAKNYLIKHGHTIEASNVKISYQEIDIIAKKGDIYVFVEVKTRTSDVLGSADEMFSATKMKNFKQAISSYIDSNNINSNYVQLDLIAVDIDKKKKVAKITHYKDVL